VKTDPWQTQQERESNAMKMELIQPFINAADAVLSQGLQGSTKVGNLTMEEDAYRRKGVAGMIALTGDIEGRIVLDLEPATAVKVASHYAGAELPESDALIKETIFELANQVVGNAISALNDQGFHFRVHPPLLLTAQEGDKTSEDTEALMIFLRDLPGLRLHECCPALQQAPDGRSRGVGSINPVAGGQWLVISDQWSVISGQ
jgi:chemotaxis protein CheX